MSALIELIGSLESLASMVEIDVRNEEELGEEGFDIYRPLKMISKGESTNEFEAFDHTAGSVAVAFFNMVRSDFGHALRITLSLRSTRTIKRVQEALILAGESFQPRGWDSWLAFRQSGWEFGYDQVQHSFAKWLEWDDAKTVERVENVFAKARPYAGELRRLRARLIASALLHSPPENQKPSPNSSMRFAGTANRGDPERVNVRGPYLGVSIDSNTRTVSRVGYEQTAKLTDRQWQMMLALLQAAGETAVLTAENYDGKCERHAMNTIRLALESRLIPLDLRTTGFRLSDLNVSQKNDA